MTEKTVTLRLAVNGQAVAPGVRAASGEIDKLGASASRAQVAARDAAGAAKGLAGASLNVASASASAAAAIDRQTEAVRRNASAVASSHSAQIAALQAQARYADQSLQSLPQQASAQAIKRASDEAYASLRQLHLLNQRVPAEQDKVNASQLRGALSSKQYAQAMRQVPAQITDIVTSLVSGQPAYMVAIQQGGQLKDSFGGIGNAARALMTALNPVVLVVGAVAAVAAVIGTAFAKGQAETYEFAKATALSGNAAHTTGGQLRQYAQDIDAVVGTEANAAAVLAQLAATGNVANEQLKKAAEAAIRLQRDAGRVHRGDGQKLLRAGQETRRYSAEAQPAISLPD